MDGLHRWITEELERLRNEMDSDFAAFATPLPDRGKAAWRWSFASGNLSGRYAQLAVLPGRGIAGAALRTERAVVLNRHGHAADLRKEDAPLLASERLEAAAAIPVRLPDSRLGVLLVGARSPHDYGADAILKLNAAAQRLSSYIPGIKGEPHS